MSGFIQVGQTAMRDPVTGEMLPAVPLYIAAEDAGKVPQVDLDNIGSILAGKMKAYVEGCEQEGVMV